MGSVSAAIRCRKCSILNRAASICMHRIPPSHWRREAYRAAPDLVNAIKGGRSHCGELSGRGYTRTDQAAGKSPRPAQRGNRQKASRERIGNCQVQVTGRRLLWGEIVFSDAPVRAKVRLSSVSNLTTEASTLRPVIRLTQCREGGPMHDGRIADYRKRRESCVRRAELKDSHADEWARLAGHWEMLAWIRERMPIVADRHGCERDHASNARRA